MQGSFERNIEQKLGNFSLDPSPQIWQDVEKALHPNQKRRGIFWWWVPLLGLLLAGGGAWWLFNSNNEPKRNIQPQSTRLERADTSYLISDEKNATEHVPTIIQQEYGIENKGQISKQKASVNEVIIRPLKENLEIRSAELSIKNTVAKEVAKQKETTSIKAASENEIKNIDKPVIKDTAGSVLIVQNLINSVTTKNTAAINAIDSTPRNAAIKKDTAVTVGNKKERWFITLGTGMLNIAQTGLLTTNQFSPAYPAANSTINSYNIIASPRNGFTVMGGVHFEYSIGKRWNLNTGLLYRYLQNHQSVGVDSVSSGGIIYYAAGSKTFQKNYAHWLQLPLGFSWILNPSTRNNFQLIFGVSLAWSFAEKWLVTDANNSSHPFYYNAAVDNRAIINLQAGIGYNINDHFQISLLGERSTTSVHQQKTESYYWQQFSFHISKALFLSPDTHKTSKQ